MLMAWVNIRATMAIFTLFLGGVLGGCAGGGSNGTPSTVSAPVVLLTSPADNATGVLLTKPIAVAFSKEMKADAFTATTFTATSSSGTVSGAITYANGYATLTPTTLLAPSTRYTVTVAGGVQASDGGVLAAPYSWSFTTGLLDPNFGNGGVVISPISMTLGDGARAVAVQADGKIVAVGYVDSGSGNYDFAVARYNTDGSLDTTFDGDGIVITAISAGRDEARAVAIQTDGQIVVAGVTSVTSNNITSTDFVVARYNSSDGSLDASFNSGGYIVTDFGATNDEVFAVALQSTGKIVVVGQTGSLTDVNFALARYTTSGMLDVTFGINGNGLQVTSFGDGFDAAYAIAIQANDKIMVAGISDNTPGLGINNDFALARYEVDGVLDNTFDNDGRVMTAVGVADEGAFAVGIQSTGKIVAAGAVLNAAGNNDFGLVRYNVDGSLDTNFAAGGPVPGTTLTDMAGGNDVALALMIQPDDKIMVGGAAFVTNQGNDLALARYHADGSADMTFDADGKTVTNISAAHDTAYGLALRPASGGKVVLVGSTGTGSDADFLLVGFIAP